ncbi:MAG: hypothetical protein QOI36_5939 [Pseudonocardiales bacterium]|nr:hypothetical protein [Pseudonocardiales bacterium]
MRIAELSNVRLKSGHSTSGSCMHVEAWWRPLRILPGEWTVFLQAVSGGKLERELIQGDSGSVLTGAIGALGS